jgi:tetratricopeptide (TPR) repeat protein
MTDTIAHAVILFNNGALQHFLNGDFDKAIEMMNGAYSMFTSYNTNCRLNHGMMMSTATNSLNNNNDTNSSCYSNHLPYAPSIMPSLQFLKDGIPSASAAATTTTTTSSSSVMDCDEVDRIVHDKSKNGILHAQSSIVDASGSSISSESSPSTAHSVYNRALILTAEDDGDATSLLTRDYYRTRAVLYYNLALVYHNIGIHRGISAALPKALQLYELALESIDHGTNLMEVQKMLMAILNNCANIYSHFFFIEETQKCFENLRIVLAATSASSSLSAASDMSTDDDYNFFFLNALFQSKELCFAPAA